MVISSVMRLIWTAVLAGALGLVFAAGAHAQVDCSNPPPDPDVIQECSDQFGGQDVFEDEGTGDGTGDGTGQNQDDTDGDQSGDVDDEDRTGDGDVDQEQDRDTDQNEGARRVRFRDFDCDDFSRADAQKVLNANRNDPFNLDSDNDGIACEEGAFVRTSRVRFLARTGPHVAAITLAGLLALAGGMALRRSAIRREAD